METWLSYRFDDLKVMEKNSYTVRLQPPQSPPKFNVVFTFWCRNITNKYSNSKRDVNIISPRLLTRKIIDAQRQRRIKSSIKVDLRTFLSREKTRRIIEKKLESWLRAPDWRKYLSQIAVKRALQQIISMPQSHNTVLIDLNLVAEYEKVLHREDNHGSEVSAEDYMVPALDSLTELLERKRANCDGTCAICMDDYVSGSDEVTCMPCLHLFHEDCIKGWLRTSHYCPVCRFEMPTNMKIRVATT